MFLKICKSSKTSLKLPIIRISIVSTLTLFFTLILFLLSSCSGNKSKAFVIEGQIAGLENKKLLLETFSFPNINGAPKFVLIDTTKTDEIGKFVVTNYLPERTICRLRAEGQQEYYILLSLFDEKMTIDAAVDATSLPTIKGSTPTIVLFQFIDNLRQKNTDIMQIQALIAQDRQSTNDSLAQHHIDQMNQQIIDYYSFIKNFADTTSEISNSILAMESLAFETEFESLKQFSNKATGGKDSAHQYVKQFADKIARFEKAMIDTQSKSFIGKQAPEIAVSNAQGEIVKLSALRGQFVLIDFWASWCGPCRKENPNLVAVYQKYKNNGFTIYSVSLDHKKEDWQKAIVTDKLVWPYHVSELSQSGSTAATNYGVTGIPASFLVDKNGVIIAENLRGPLLEQKVAELMNQN